MELTSHHQPEFQKGQKETLTYMSYQHARILLAGIHLGSVMRVPPGRTLNQNDWPMTTQKLILLPKICKPPSRVALLGSLQFNLVQSLSRVQLFATPWTVAHQASLSHHHLPDLTQTHVHQVSNDIQLSHPFLLLPSVFPSTRVFSKESALHIRWSRYLLKDMGNVKTWSEFLLSCKGKG